ncbi:dimethylallyl, adenosine tRNA methylthiotransferase [Wolffia australiana]
MALRSTSATGRGIGAAASYGVFPLLCRSSSPGLASPWPSQKQRGICCVGWDPEGILGPARGGHIARLEFKKQLMKDAGAREEISRQIRQESERRRALRESRAVPDTIHGLIEFFLDTEAREMEFEIARLRQRLNKEFFDHVQRELSQLKFAVSRTAEMEDRLVELEAMQKVLEEGIEAYDKMQQDLVLARERLTKILQSEDKKATLLEMVERNELNRPVLALLDENIASAIKSDQKEAAAFMEQIRATMLKYMTV